MIDVRLYSAILRSLEQTHCARMWFYMSDQLFIARFFFFFFLLSTEVVYLQRWHGWCHMKLQPSRRKFCVRHTTVHHVTSCKGTYVRCMNCLQLTCLQAVGEVEVVVWPRLSGADAVTVVRRMLGLLSLVGR